MYKVKLMNKISSEGLDYFNEDYEYGETLENEDAILLRSASLHEYEFTNNVKAIARAGAGVNNIPVEKCSEKGIVVFNKDTNFRHFLSYTRWKCQCRKRTCLMCFIFIEP